MGADLILTHAVLPHLPDGRPAFLAEYDAKTAKATPAPYAEAMRAQIHARVNAADGDTLLAIMENLFYPFREEEDTTDAAIITEGRERLHKIVDEYVFSDGEDRLRDITFLVVGDRLAIFTGGMSWGDTPSDSYDDISLLGDSRVTDFELEL